jgi:hypothetical protein
MFRGQKTLNQTISAKNEKYEHDGRFIFEINILFCGDNSWTIALTQMKLSIMKDSAHTYEFYLDNYFLYKTFWIWRILKLLRWMKNLHQSMWDHIILYSDRSSEDEQLLMRPLMRESKNINMASGWMVKFTFYFMNRTHEPLHLVKWSFV